MHPLHRITVAALPLLLAACFERTQPSVENNVRPVQAVRVALASDTEQRAFAGTIKPRREAEVGFRAAGRIATRLVDMGARVRAGDVLARLDPADLTLSVRSAEADLASAEAQAEQAQADAARSRTLRGQGWASAATDEVKQATARAATEKVASARAALSLARNRLDYADLRAQTPAPWWPRGNRCCGWRRRARRKPKSSCRNWRCRTRPARARPSRCGRGPICR
jgi:multidrug efflux pump subunit AcrA (membrane-fusion protein)